MKFWRGLETAFEWFWMTGIVVSVAVWLWWGVSVVIDVLIYGGF